MSNPRSTNLIVVILGLFLGWLLSPITNLFNPPIQAQGVPTMTNETFIAILLFIGAVIAAVLYVLDRTNRRLADALPPQLLPLISIALDALATLATQTETPLDDEIIQRLRDALGLTQAQAAALAKVIAPASNKSLQRVPMVRPVDIPEAG